jgi:hypothetical protein
MVKWLLELGGSELQFSSGKVILASPCEVSFQKEMILELQKSSPRMKLKKENHEIFTEATPILIAKYLLNLNGSELKNFFLWWCHQFKFDCSQHEVLSQLVPETDSGWRELRPEKRIALFLGVAIKSSEFSYAFLEDLHFEHNAQIFLFNFIKNMTQTSSHQVIVFWSYRLQLQHSVPLFFKGFKHHAA